MQSLIFEEIKSSNKQYAFGRGKYGEFEVIIMDNGYINATKLCALGGKQLKEWLKLNKCKEVFSYYESMGGNFPIAKILIKGGDNQEVTGTYMPNRIITHIASWVSVRFAFMVSDIVEEYIIKEHRLELALLAESNLLLKTENLSLLEKMDILLAKTDNILDKNNQLLDQNEIIADELLETKDILMDTQEEVVQTSNEMVKVNIKLGIACNERVPRPDKKSIEHFVFLKLSNPITKINGITYIYQVVRAKKVSLRSMINRNPGDVLLDLQCVPNSMLLFNFIRKESRTNPKAGYKCCGNSINLFIEEDEFIKFIHESYNHRLTIKTV
jgi:hypothetical protein